MQPNNLNIAGNERILIFPALSPKISGKQIYFLFTLGQIEDIIRNASIYPLPFSPPYILGLAEWRDNVLPVLSLEECLGLPPSESTEAVRLVIIRSGEKKIRGIFRVDPSIRLISMPVSCSPVQSAPWLSRNDLVRGIYEWDEGFLVAVRMDNILRGDIYPEKRTKN